MPSVQKGGLFVGREDILGQLEELWLKPGQVDSLVLYGIDDDELLEQATAEGRLDPPRPQPGPHSREELAAICGLQPPEALQAALHTLEAHDVTVPTAAGTWSFTVELMRRWVRQGGADAKAQGKPELGRTATPSAALSAANSPLQLYATQTASKTSKRRTSAQALSR